MKKFESKNIIFVITLLALFLLAAHLTKKGTPIFSGDSQPKFPPLSHHLLVTPSTYSIASVWNYCWVHADYFLQGRAPLANAAATIVLGFSPLVRAYDPVAWQLDTVNNIDGSPLTHGGSSVQVSITGPSLLRPAVHDLRNGTYIVLFWIADPGEYQAHITLRWQGCKAYVHCNSSETRQGLETVRNLTFTVVQSLLPPPHFGAAQTNTEGRWVHESTLPEDIRQSLHPLLAGPYVWRQFDPDDVVLRRPFPLEALRGRWLYLVGDSLSDNSYSQLIEQIVRPACEEANVDLLVNRGDGSLMKEQVSRPWPRRDGMHLFYCPSLNATISFTYFPDFYPVSGSGQTRYPLIDSTTKSIPSLNKISFDLPTWLHHLRTVMASTSNSIPPFVRPDALVLNFGLHFVAQMDPPIYEMIVRHMLMVLRTEFPSEGSKLFWRTTALTHFEEDDLAGAWSCRSPERTQLANEIVIKLAQSAGLDVMDFAQLSAPRADAAPDNRHYSRGNVKATYNNLLLHKLLGLLAT